MSIPPSPEGSGIRRIRDLCREHGVAEPLIEVSASWVTTTFHRPTSELGTRTGLRQESRQESRQKSRAKGIEQRILSILRHTPRSRSEISNGLGHKSVSGRLNEAIRLLMDDKPIEYTIPEKPNSRLQKYRLTENGKSRLAELVEGRS